MSQISCTGMYCEYRYLNESVHQLSLNESHLVPTYSIYLLLRLVIYGFSTKDGSTKQHVAVKKKYMHSSYTNTFYARLLSSAAFHCSCIFTDFISRLSIVRNIATTRIDI